MFLAPHLLESSPWLRGIDRLIQQGFGHQALPPGLRLRQDEQGWTLEADLPGATRDGLGLEVVAGELRLKLGENQNFALKLGSGVDASGIQARFDLGVLEVRLPKTATAETRQITIH